VADAPCPPFAASQIALDSSLLPIANVCSGDVSVGPRSSGRSPSDWNTTLGFAQNELNKIGALVQEHRALLLKAWHAYFKSGNGNTDGQAGPGH
jgi:hypothetical protein